jgi:hypothetical protein
MKNLCLTLSLIICLYQLTHAQSDSAHITLIAAKLQKQTATQPVEKVYLHFNKPFYSAGDTIWFKGYVTVGVHHQPSALSGVLYVDLLDSKDKLVKSIMLKSDNGISAGEFALDAGLAPGNYRVRAYTTWMRNFGNEYFFSAAILVGDLRTNALQISPSFSLSSLNNRETVNTKLTYTDKSGLPFSSRQVSYQVRADTNLLYTGKGVTDGSGNIQFSFPGQTAPNQHVHIISHFKLANDVLIDKAIPLNIPNENTDVQFFPEGGQLVNGVRSKVAFKAIGTNGLGVEIKGTIIDNENNEVAEFQSQHLGMGVFALTPQSGKTYMAKITLGGDLAKTVKLPIANEKGFVLAVNNNPADSTKLNIRIATNEATLNEKKDQSFYIAGQVSGAIYYTTAGKLDNTSFTASVPKNKFPTGIAQFTLFSNTNEPLNERVVFIQNNTDILNLDINSSKNTYAAKEKTSLAFNAKDNTGKPVQGSFSLTIYNEDYNNTGENNESTILSNILLTSDLKGNIEQPNSYFNNPNNQAKTDLDVLLLTQGYRRFDWQEVISDHYPNIVYQPEKDLHLSGTLTTPAGKLVAKGKVSILSVADNISIDTTSDEQGKFTLANVDFQDTTKQVLIQARTANGNKDVNIKLNGKTPPPVFKTVATETGLPLFVSTSNTVTKSGTASLPADTAQLIKTIKAAGNKVDRRVELKEVTVKERKNAGTELAPWVTVNPNSANLNGPGHADYVITSKDLENCIDFFDCLMNKIPGITRKTTRTGTLYYFARHTAQSIKGIPNIVYMLDGVIVTQTDLGSVNVSDVATVEVLNSSSYLNVYGTTAPYGMLIITTKRGRDDPSKDYNAQVSSGVITTKFKGYYKAAQFYLPKYTVKDAVISDTRDAVYWNPNVVTDANGTFPIEYFNSDVKGTYRAVVEGIDDNGNIGRFVYRYKVE